MRLPSGKVGFSKAMSNKWIRVDKSAADGPRVFRVVDSVEDEVQRRLQLVQGGQAEKLGEKERSELRKRKLLTEVTLKTYWVSKGSAFSTSISKQETELSPEMISSGSWRDRPFKPYNFLAHGVLPDSGHLHPLLKVRTQFRQIFLEMGFTEMPTDNFIESSFWNFDALFQPQQHPARDQHDTFFLRDPAEALQLPMDYVHRVKRTHSQGGYGSQGYKYNWKLEEARKNLLRTHTTSASARALYRLAQKVQLSLGKQFLPHSKIAQKVRKFPRIPSAPTRAQPPFCQHFRLQRGAFVTMNELHSPPRLVHGLHCGSCSVLYILWVWTTWQLRPWASPVPGPVAPISQGLLGRFFFLYFKLIHSYGKILIHATNVHLLSPSNLAWGGGGKRTQGA
ncbi:phenylalanyl-trna synthetase alpha [Lynx pardinus]|nr:phenylalanyl-trna synthetase alpha [Lynx pardinus]